MSDKKTSVIVLVTSLCVLGLALAVLLACTATIVATYTTENQQYTHTSCTTIQATQHQNLTCDECSRAATIDDNGDGALHCRTRASPCVCVIVQYEALHVTTGVAYTGETNRDVSEERNVTAATGRGGEQGQQTTRVPTQEILIAEGDEVGEEASGGVETRAAVLFMSMDVLKNNNGTCSCAYCDQDLEREAAAIRTFLQLYSTPLSTYSCYYGVTNHGYAIPDISYSYTLVLHTVLWPTGVSVLAMCGVGLGVVMYTRYRAKKHVRERIRRLAEDVEEHRRLAQLSLPAWDLVDNVPDPHGLM